jgi:hypothetical protein
MRLKDKEKENQFMKSKMMKLAFFSKVLCLALIMVVGCSAAAVAQSDKPWTAVGSDGTPDEGDPVTYTGNIAYLDGDSAVMRYNVVAVDGLINDGPLAAFPRMTVRFRDNGDNNRIVVRLRRIGIDGGNSVSILTLDSNDYAGSSSFQTRSVSACGDDSFTFDFDNYAYYIEATLTRTGLPVTTGLSSIKLDLGGTCFGILPPQ